MFGNVLKKACFVVVTVCALGGVVQAQDSKGTGVQSEADVIGTIKTPRVRFTYPTDGATVPQSFTAKFEVEGFKIATAGNMEPGTGHFHIIIDKPAVKEGEPIPFDSNHLHFGKGETEAVVKLKPGKHKLTLQFADGAHRAYGGSLVQTINVTVK